MSGDGIVDTIDNVLNDYDTSLDAMRWAPEEVAGHGFNAPRIQDVLRTMGSELSVGSSGGVAISTDGEDWIALGQLSEPMSLRFEHEPRFVLDSNLEAWTDAMHRAVVSLHTLEPAMRRATDAMREIRWSPPADARSNLTGLRGTPGITFHDDDPRERALEARRNRNTGPQRTPFKHRGR